MHLVTLLPELKSQSPENIVNQVRKCGAARPRLSKPMPSPRSVIELHTRPILPVVVVVALGVAKGWSLHERRQVPGGTGAELASLRD